MGAAIILLLNTVTQQNIRNPGYGIGGPVPEPEKGFHTFGFMATVAAIVIAPVVVYFGLG